MKPHLVTKPCNNKNQYQNIPSVRFVLMRIYTEIIYGQFHGGCTYALLSLRCYASQFKMNKYFG